MSSLAAAPRWQLFALLVLLGFATYANALGNRWALDDVSIIPENEVVTGPQWSRVFAGPYWHNRDDVPALYRPGLLAAFALEWRAFGDRPAAFHAVGVVLHVLVAVLVMLLAAAFVPAVAAFAGGAVFAVHPVHVEAVANVVGQGELIASLLYLAACLIFVGWTPERTSGRVCRTLAVAVLYALALGVKEIAVTLPAMLMVLGFARGEGPHSLRSFGATVRREIPLLLVLAAVLATYLAQRVWVLGSLAGDTPAPDLIGLTTGQRLLTGLSLWPTYLRLLFFPLDLASDYGAGVLLPAVRVRADVLFGAALMALVVGAALRGWARGPAALAAAWFIVAILPVSNLVIPTGTLLAERTLYLPSVALALSVSFLVAAVPLSAPGTLRALGWGTVVVVAALASRTVLRNPAWMDTFTVFNVLAVEHPESWLSHRARARGLLRVGQTDAALAEFDEAVRLTPNNYALLLEAGTRYKDDGRFDQAVPLLEHALRLRPDGPGAYRSLAEARLLQGDGRAAHSIALAGLARWGADHDLWGLVSESYVAKGDLGAAIRAREAASAFALEADRAGDAERLAELRGAAAARVVHVHEADR